MIGHRVTRPRRAGSWGFVRSAAAALVVSCSPQGGSGGTGIAPPPPAAAPLARSGSGTASAQTALPSGPLAAPTDAGPKPSEPGAAVAPAPVISGDEAEEILFPAVKDRRVHRATCPSSLPDDARIRCLLGIRFQGDDAARSTAIALYALAGSVAGVEGDRLFDGGYRGTIHLVPEPPTFRYHVHLSWVAEAARDHDAFFKGLTAGHPDAAVRYRWKPIALRYFRSVGKRTPSAYAGGWTIAYNVSGSLHTSASAVRETMFHEIFHLNDAAHDRWSEAALSPLYDGIVRACGTGFACLTPYTPNSTTVKGGTYYAFQPGNGVVEYAAELALRYYREQRALIRREPPIRPAFKCGPSANRRAWELVVNEFFGGIDLTAPCH